MATLSDDVRDIIDDVFVANGVKSDSATAGKHRGSDTLTRYVDKAVADRRPIVLHRTGKRVL